MATIRKLKSGNYQVQIRLSGLKPITKTFPTKTLATQFQRKVEGDKKLQLALGDPCSSGITLGELIDEYMKQYQGKDHGLPISLTWWKNYCGELVVNKCTVSVIRKGINQLVEGYVHIGNGRGKTKGKTKELGRKRSGATVNRYKANLSSIFEFGKEHYNFANNPCREIKAKPENPHLERFLTVEEQEKLIKICKKSNWDKLYLLVLMALTTGARKGELMGLKWIDIDFKNLNAKLIQTKNGTNRLLPLTNSVIEELKIHRDIGNHLIFHNTLTKNKPFNINKVYAKALSDSGISNFRFHDLRHTAASNLAQNGANLLEIAEVLGHSNTTVTKRYAHLCIDHKRDLINRVMGSLGK